MSSNPEIRQLPAGHGWIWAKESLNLVLRQPLPLLLIGLVLQLVLGLTQVPLLGLLVLLAIPVLTAGVLQAMNLTDRGERPTLGVLFAGMGSPAMGHLLLLGVLLLAGSMLAAVMMVMPVMAGLDPDLVSRLEQGDFTALEELPLEEFHKVFIAMLIGMAITGTLSYFAIPLVWFRGLNIWSAIGLGVKAMLRNWQAFLVLGIVVFGVGLLLGLLVSSLILSVGAGSPLWMLVILPMIAFQLFMFAVQYVSYRDIFQMETPAPAQDDNQLLA